MPNTFGADGAGFTFSLHISDPHLQEAITVMSAQTLTLYDNDTVLALNLFWTSGKNCKQVKTKLNYLYSCSKMT